MWAACGQCEKAQIVHAGSKHGAECGQVWTMWIMILLDLKKTPVWGNGAAQRNSGSNKKRMGTLSTLSTNRAGAFSLFAGFLSFVGNVGNCFLDCPHCPHIARPTATPASLPTTPATISAIVHIVHNAHTTPARSARVSARGLLAAQLAGRAVRYLIAS